MTETVFQVIGYILTIALGGLALWYKHSGVMKELVAKNILYAEEEYGDLVNAGGKKFNQVVDWLYEMIPAVVRPFMPRKFVEKLVQSVFDAMETYAKIQIDPDGFFFPEYPVYLGERETLGETDVAGEPETSGEPEATESLEVAELPEVTA